MSRTRNLLPLILFLMPSLAWAVVDLKIERRPPTPAAVKVGESVIFSLVILHEASSTEDANGVEVEITFTSPVAVGSPSSCTATRNIVKCRGVGLVRQGTSFLLRIEVSPTVTGSFYGASTVITRSLPADSNRANERGATSAVTVTAADPTLNDYWVRETVDSGGVVGSYSSLDLVDDLAHIAYYDETNRSLKYAVHASADIGDWNIQSVVTPADDTEDLGRFADMAVGEDAAGDLMTHFTTRKIDSNGNDEVHYWRLNAAGSASRTALIDSDTTVGPGRVAVAPDNRASVIYKNTGGVASPCPPDTDPATVGNQTDGRIYHKWYNLDGTQAGCAFITSDVAAGPMAFAIDPSGMAHVVYSYIDPLDSRASLKYGRSVIPAAGGAYDWSAARGGFVSGRYRFSRVATVADQVHLSIAIEGGGATSQRHICAYDPASKDLLYFLQRTTGILSSPWIVDGTLSETDSSDVGKYCQIAVDETRDLLQIIYYDEENNLLKYARRRLSWNGAWIISTVDSGAGLDVGQFTSMKVDSQGLLHVSYHDATTGDLKYATNANICGNSLLEADSGEQCDDGNRANEDGCDVTCQLEFCGDGLLNNNNTEQCDDGNTVTEACAYGSTSCLVCAANCQIGPGSSTSFCGDGRVDTANETCDDSGRADGDGCSATCQTESVCPNSRCESDETSATCPADCGSSCGNNVCDNGETNATCQRDCPAVCPNMICETGETNATCPADCLASCGNNACDNGETYATCPRDCPAVCGNGVVEGTEQCDDRNTTAGDGCSSACQTEGGGGPVCGDNKKEGNEECDDGNMNSGDGCSATCRTELPAAVCGNRIVETGEECDDGNTADGDGCNASCKNERTVAPPTPSPIVPPPPGKPARGGCALIKG